MFGATAHSLNLEDSNQLIGVIAYPLLNLLIGIWLFFDDPKKPFQWIRLFFMATLGALQVYVAADCISTVEGGALFILVVLILLMFIANGAILYSELKTMNRKC